MINKYFSNKKKNEKIIQRIVFPRIVFIEEIEKIERMEQKKRDTKIYLFPNSLLLEKKEPKKEIKKNNLHLNPNSSESSNHHQNDDKNNISNSSNIFEILDQLEKEKKKPEKIENKNTCMGCKSENSFIEDYKSGIIVCSVCGMVDEEIIDYGPEWRQYNNDDNRGDGVSRCGCPTNPFFPKSSQGTIIAGYINSRLNRKQKWNYMVYKERSLNTVFEFISQSCVKKNIPKIIIDTAKILYKRINDCKHKYGNNVGKQIIIRGDNRLSIMAACVFKACEMNKNPRNIKEIASIFGLDEKKVTKGNKHFEKIIKNTDDETILVDGLTTSTAQDYIRRHCVNLKIDKQNTDLAVKIANNCCKMKIASDHNPLSIAAGSILVMAKYNDLNIEKKDIALSTGTSDVTIGKIYKKIHKYVDALVDDDATNYLISVFKING